MSLPPEMDRYLRHLLESGKVRCIVGPAATRGPRGTVHFARTPAEVDRFVLSPLADANVLVHLTSAEARRDRSRFPVAVLARGCQTRMLNQLFAEQGLNREEVHVVGLGHCRGVIDSRRLLARRPDLRGFPAVREEEDEYVFGGLSGGEWRLPRQAVLKRRCLCCRHREPLVADHLFGLVADAEWSVPEDAVRGAEVEAIEQLAPAERWEFWQAHLERCIRCHACRDACPLCYCDDCILDRLQPRWVNRSTDVSENTAYQLLRILHLVGRCTSCGQCEEACPVQLPLSLLTGKMEREVHEHYGFESGRDPAGEHLLSVFDPDARETAGRAER